MKEREREKEMQHATVGYIMSILKYHEYVLFRLWLIS